MFSLGSFLERQEDLSLLFEYLLFPSENLLSQLSLGKSCLMIIITTILTAPIKLHYTYIPVHLFLLDVWKTRVTCTIVPRYSKSIYRT